MALHLSNQTWISYMEHIRTLLLSYHLHQAFLAYPETPVAPGPCTFCVSCTFLGFTFLRIQVVSRNFILFIKRRCLWFYLMISSGRHMVKFIRHILVLFYQTLTLSNLNAVKMSSCYVSNHAPFRRLNNLLSLQAICIFSCKVFLP